MNPLCRTCAWFEPTVLPGSDFGSCHRFPPTAGPRTPAQWPEVRPHWWCGEHKPLDGS